MDDDFVAKPQELVTLFQTRLTAVVVAGVGHDPVRATGLLLHKLPSIQGQTTERRAQLWRLASTAAKSMSIREQIARIARRQGVQAKAWMDRYRLTPEQLERPPPNEGVE